MTVDSTNPRSQQLFLPGSTQDGYGLNSFNTLGRHTMFGGLYIQTNPGGTPVLVGGVQSFSMREINNTQWRAQSGTDWLEPVFGMRSWQGSGNRFQIRTADLQQIVQGLFGSAGPNDIDWRQLPFQLQYQYYYQSVTGNGSGGNKYYEAVNWNWMTIFITEYEWTFTSPMELLSENFTFIGRGYSRSVGITGGAQGTMGNDSALWGGVGTSGNA